MFWKRFIKDYLIFSKKERIAALCILTAVLSAYFIPRLFARPETTFIVENNLLSGTRIDSLQRNSQHYKDDEDEFSNYTTHFKPKKEPAFVNGALFQFDPNSISADEWRRLGLNEKTTKTIINYRSKGGKFYKPEDLMRIWGMPEGFYERVKGHVVIPSVERRTYPENNYPKSSYKEERRSVAVNINEADTTALIALPGIGSKLASRIINFRDKLGGFYSIDQVGETYGVPDSTFQKIKSRLVVNGTTVRKLDINTATKDELKAHPYIKWNLANAIVEYRNQHGAFKSLEDLRNIGAIDEAAFKKLINYLSL